MIKLLLGKYSYNLDAKGRVSIPIKFREDIGESFVITKGLDNCLFIYSTTEWEKFEEKLKMLPLTNKEARGFVRFFFSGATLCQVDKQGRVNIPQDLRDYANLVKEVCIIGVSSRIEIWNKDRFENYTSPENMDVEQIASLMSELGI